MINYTYSINTKNNNNMNASNLEIFPPKNYVNFFTKHFLFIFFAVQLTKRAQK